MRIFTRESDRILDETLIRTARLSLWQLFSISFDTEWTPNKHQAID